MAELFQRDDPADFALPGDEEKLPSVAEPSQEEESQTVETIAENTPEGRPRDDQGRFVSETETEPEVTEEIAAETEARLLAGKFKSQEELEAAYLEQESFKGRLTNEIGELRQAFQQSQPQQQQYDPAAISALIEESPDVATELAYTSGNQPVLQAAFQSWMQEDETAAKLWATTKRLDAMQAQNEQSQAQVTQSAQAREYADAFQTFAQEHPDVEQYAEAMQDVARQHSVVAEMLQSKNPQSKLQAFEFLYTKARGRASDNLDEATKAVAREHAEQTQRVKTEGILATSTASIPEAKPSAAEQIGAEWDKQNAPFQAGWNI